jgi:hypothetical protein
LSIRRRKQDQTDSDQLSGLVLLQVAKGSQSLAGSDLCQFGGGLTALALALARDFCPVCNLEEAWTSGRDERNGVPAIELRCGVFFNGL